VPDTHLIAAGVQAKEPLFEKRATRNARNNKRLAPATQSIGLQSRFKKTNYLRNLSKMVLVSET
jgi:hypothetical protein